MASTFSQSLAFLNSITSACPLPNRSASKPSLAAPHLRAAGPRFTCSSNRTPTNSNQESPLILDRRDVLLGLGGLTSAMPALAKPVMPPDIQGQSCKTATDPSIPPDSDLLKCCPPYQGTGIKIKEYNFPRTKLRVRRPAQDVINDKEYMEQLEEAVRRMKELPAEDPHNFYQQAKIHCAYCNGAYNQLGTNVPLQVHYSWLFLPWHRYYIHFFERILGNLIGDETFALPFWNYDNPIGMKFPEIYFYSKSSPLYNQSRDPDHTPGKPPALLDYRYGYGRPGGTGKEGEELIKENLDYMRKVFKEGELLPELFLGDAVSAGEEATTKGMGQIEIIHNSLHQWVGPTEKPHTDMGSFATAPRDMSFYGVHANVDRLWNLYQARSGYRVEFQDPDWLEATFVFYDEYRDLVTAKVKDCLKLSKLCATYEEVPSPWLGKVAKPKPTPAKSLPKKSLVTVSEFGPGTKALDQVVRVLVVRPKKNRSRDEKMDEAEVLFVNDIQVAGGTEARFDVFVSTTDGNLATPERGEFVGSFVKLADDKKVEKGKERKAVLKLGITSSLEDLDAEDAEKLVVTLVPRFGEVSVGGVEIKLIKTNRRF